MRNIINKTRALVTPFSAMLALLVVGVIVIALTADDYGVSWDEGVQASYGELVYDYFASGGTDRSCNQYQNLRFYGPLFDLLCAVAYRPWPQFDYLIRHALTAACALATLPAVFRIGKKLGSGWIGVASALGLAMMPQFYGHAFVNSKDIPFACAFAWAIGASADLLDKPFTRRRILFTGALLGLAMCARPGSLPLLLLIFIVLLGWMLLRADTRSALLTRRSLLSLVGIWVIAYTVMLVPWPWAHENALLHPIRAVMEAARFSKPITVLFEGQSYASTSLPWHYLPRHILITTPIPFLLLATVGLLVSVSEQSRRRSLHLFAVQAWIGLPLLLYFAFRPHVYDGIRHFLFILPAIAILAGYACFRIVDLFRTPAARSLAGGACVLLLLYPLPSIIRLHPYEMTYFNELVGGTRGASGRYDTDYWVTSYREAIEWVNEQAARRPDRPTRVLVAIHRGASASVIRFQSRNVECSILENSPPNLTLPGRYDYYIGTTRGGASELFPDSPVVHRISRAGATFTVIRSR